MFRLNMCITQLFPDFKYFIPILLGLHRSLDQHVQFFPRNACPYCQHLILLDYESLDRRKMMKATFIYITAGSTDEAKKIGRELISNRLAACVNIIDNMHSMFWWEDEIQEDREVILIAKTKESLVTELIDKVKSVHSYDCPCIVSLPILDGNRGFLDWIAQQTK